MELIIVTLIIFIPAFLLINKYLDKRYGIVNKNLLERIAKLELSTNDLTDLNNRLDNQVKALKEVNKRIDGMIISKIV